MARIPVPDVLFRVLGRQLGGPSGPLGGLVARMLNKGNAVPVAAAVEALGLSGTEAVADIGFGGGVGLDLLLAATDRGGRVHGVEPSVDMLARARKAHPEAVAAGRLELHEATMASLPFADGALDGWITTNTVYFVDDLDVALREAARVLAPGARGVVGIAEPEWMARQPFARHGFTVRPVAEVVQALEATGLEVEHRTLGHREPAFHLLVGTRPGVRS